MAAATAVVLFVAVGASQADTICVNPDKASCEATIQAAVNLATAGDEIKLASGVYFENVVIDKRVTVVGGKNAILDPTFPGTCSVTTTTECYSVGDCPGMETCNNVGDGDGISVDANDVVLRGFTIRNGQSNSIQLETHDFTGIGVTGTEIRNMRLVAPSDDCIRGAGGTSTGPTTVRGNEFTACGEECLDLSAGTWNKVEVSKNKMMQCDGAGVEIDGDSAIVENNRMTNLDGIGVDLSGDRAEVVGNRINSTYYEGVEVSGDDALIQSNRLENTGEGGIYLSGNGATITKNRITGSAGDNAIDFNGDGGEISRNTIKNTEQAGMAVYCNDGGTCTDGIVIERNRLTDVGFDDYEGIYVDAQDGTGGVDIRRNRLRNVGYTGIDYNAAAGSGPARIKLNSVRTAGHRWDDCFDFEDGDLDSFVIDSNTARDCGGNGFSLDGTDHKLTSNKVKNTGENGVDVDGSAVNIKVSENKIRGAALNGVEIESGATDTTVTDNTIKKNRLDICDEGTTSTIADNSLEQDVETEFCANL
jgi:nitrous oxidase accessory protein NosD